MIRVKAQDIKVYELSERARYNPAFISPNKKKEAGGVTVTL